MAALTERNWYRPYARLGVEIGPTASCSGLQSKVIQLALSAEAIQWYGNVARYLSTFEDGKESINSPSYRASPENSTPVAWTDVLDAAGVRISMDGKGRWIDNVFIERLWAA